MSQVNLVLSYLRDFNSGQSTRIRAYRNHFIATISWVLEALVQEWHR